MSEVADPVFLVLGFCLLVLCAVLWTVVRGLVQIAGARMRSRDRERMDYLQIIERILEKKDSPVHLHPDVAVRHAQERAAAVREAADVEKRASGNAFRGPAKAKMPTVLGKEAKDLAEEAASHFR
ncbi:hypothetical protein AMJ71_06125 [candidate division TA06 bacterium SM1_40]|uniref:Uncharacterized protein n=1 Tax=candidate division TA06 bacterium SM1_40 TaxID=1703773 RepID=A0A0S8JI99_UNCT6|nr:MAG: hypothetical protein AMJ71_06125 [candidate division TA06 bacterium SM1_40]